MSQLTLFLVMTIVFIVISEWIGAGYAPSKLIADFKKSLEDEIITLKVTEKFETAHGGGLGPIYQKYHLIGIDNSTKREAEVIINDATTYHKVKKGDVLSFVCAYTESSTHNCKYTITKEEIANIGKVPRGNMTDRDCQFIRQFTGKVCA